MAKKKSRSESKDKKIPDYMYEIYGLILVVFSLVAIVTNSLASKIVRYFSVFLVGNAYIILLLIWFLTGLYLIVKRALPKYDINKLVGFLLLSIAVLSAMHYRYVEELSGIDIIKVTIDNVMKSFSGYSVTNTGGGLIGAFFALVFSTIFGELGYKIVCVFLVIVSCILLFNLSLSKIYTSITTSAVSMYNAIKKAFLGFVKTDKKPKEKKKPTDLKINVYEEENIKVPANNKVEEEIKEEVQYIQAEVSTVEVNKEYKLPPISLLNSDTKSNKPSVEEVKLTADNLIRVLGDFEIDAVIKNANVGPTVTQYEIELKAGTKVAKLKGITTEIALALAAKDVRIEAPIPGKSTIGIEIPNMVRSSVSFREVMTLIPDSMGKLAVPIGKDITNKTNILEINKTPHLLVAGSTGSGKSVCINGIICSILMRATPDEVKFVMVDPKKVELNGYNGIPHLLSPVVTDPKKASIALKNIVSEMEKRYDLFAATKTRNIESYNEYIDEYNVTAENKMKKLPYIIVIVDELADLMLVAKSEVEDSILRITQMARAAGIHLIIATQRPSTDVITGVIKANIPSRIAFAVASGIDSRTILNTTGAEKLIGKGDCLSMPMGSNSPVRLQGAFLPDEEINKIVAHVINEQKADYSMDITRDESGHKDSDSGLYEEEEYEDPMYNEIVEFAITTGKISASLVQRRFRLGYNRAARVIDLLEERGVCGPSNGSKPREVLISRGEE